MDTSDPDIDFDNDGVCTHCRSYGRMIRDIHMSENERKLLLQKTVEKIKRQGSSCQYDCVIGLSGGVDSTYTAYLVKNMGMRPLAVHLDNGWDTEIAVSNIEKTVKRLNIDLYTHVIDWTEFRDMQLSYFKASVADIEVLTDHAIWAVLYRQAARHGIKYIINGANVTSEFILPLSWISDKNDLRNIKAIQQRFGTQKIKTFPTLGFLKLNCYKYIQNIKVFMILDYVDYIKKDAIKIIENELDWRNYGGKHHESFFTKFFQAYILPEKFKIDKRRAHLSTLICSKQITREAALDELKKASYNSEELKEDTDYIIKKLGITGNEFNEIMKMPLKKYTDYPSYHNNISYIMCRFLFRKLKGI
ncbi:MAG: ExsB family protein [Lentisphaerae bacterium GWF2_45_14]|nr:MAG: ExsB family protein [Lentisphaerae bacterium GWF2_45_14]